MDIGHINIYIYVCVESVNEYTVFFYRKCLLWPLRNSCIAIKTCLTNSIPFHYILFNPCVRIAQNAVKSKVSLDPSMDIYADNCNCWLKVFVLWFFFFHSFYFLLLVMRFRNLTSIIVIITGYCLWLLLLLQLLLHRFLRWWSDIQCR